MQAAVDVIEGVDDEEDGTLFRDVFTSAHRGQDVGHHETTSPEGSGSSSSSSAVNCARRAPLAAPPPPRRHGRVARSVEQRAKKPKAVAAPKSKTVTKKTVTKKKTSLQRPRAAAAPSATRRAETAEQAVAAPAVAAPAATAAVATAAAAALRRSAPDLAPPRSDGIGLADSQANLVPPMIQKRSKPERLSGPHATVSRTGTAQPVVAMPAAKPAIAPGPKVTTARWAAAALRGGAPDLASAQTPRKDGIFIGLADSQANLAAPRSPKRSRPERQSGARATVVTDEFADNPLVDMSIATAEKTWKHTWGTAREEHVLGKGSFGKVILVMHRSTGQLAACKQMLGGEDAKDNLQAELEFAKILLPAPASKHIGSFGQHHRVECHHVRTL